LNTADLAAKPLQVYKSADALSCIGSSIDSRPKS
jgi:hypothetical protein